MSFGGDNVYELGVEEMRSGKESPLPRIASRRMKYLTSIMVASKD